MLPAGRTLASANGLGEGEGDDGESNGNSGACHSLLKLVMFFFNGVFWLLGLVIFSLGVAVHLDEGFRIAISDHVPAAKIGANLFIVVGVVMVTTGFLGCCGAVRESQCLVSFFFMILALVFGLLVGAGVWAAVSKRQLTEILEQQLQVRIDNYYLSEASRDTMDSIQNLFKCCGSREGAVDYQRANLKIPDSCGGRFSNADSCFYKISLSLASNLEKITVTAVSIAFFALLGMVLSLMLCCNMREMQRIR